MKIDRKNMFDLTWIVNTFFDCMPLLLHNSQSIQVFVKIKLLFLAGKMFLKRLVKFNVGLEQGCTAYGLRMLLIK